MRQGQLAYESALYGKGISLWLDHGFVQDSWVLCWYLVGKAIIINAEQLDFIILFVYGVPTPPRPPIGPCWPC